VKQWQNSNPVYIAGAMTPPTNHRVRSCAKCNKKLETMAEAEVSKYLKTDPGFQQYKKDVRALADFLDQQ